MTPFDIQRCYVVNLTRRTDRLESFLRALPVPWMLPSIQVFEAIDGDLVQPPGWWHHKACRQGAWGCYRSHLTVLEQCLNEGIERVIIFEDDITLKDNFNQRIVEFLEDLPEDTEMFYLGGHHHHVPPKPVSKTIDRVTFTLGTYAYGFSSREGIEKAYKHLNEAHLYENHHIDWQYAQFAHRVNVYCPVDWLVQHEGGYSDVANSYRAPLVQKIG